MKIKKTKDGWEVTTIDGTIPSQKITPMSKPAEPPKPIPIIPPIPPFIHPCVPIPIPKIPTTPTSSKTHCFKTLKEMLKFVEDYYTDKKEK